jgi:transcriptional regulator with XRE-family HTH domain
LSRASRRWTLKNREWFKWVMKNPGTGVPYSLDSLAEASGCGRGLIEKLANGSQKTADVDDALALAEAVGVAILTLFAPPATPNQVTPTTDPDQKE